MIPPASAERLARLRALPEAADHLVVLEVAGPLRDLVLFEEPGEHLGRRLGHGDGMRERGHEAPGYPPAGLGPRTGRNGMTSAWAAGSSPRSVASSLLQRRDPRGHGLQRVRDRVRQVDPVGVRALGAAALDAHRVAGIADDGGVRRHLVDDDGVGADLGAVADGDRTEQLGPGADRDVVLHGRVALAGLEARAAERDALVHRHVVADLSRLADHDAHAVVDEQPLADLRRRVDLDPGQRAREVRERARRHRDAGGVQRVRHAVHEQRVQARPAGQDLGGRDAGGRRVALAHGRHVAPQLTGDPADRPQTQHPPGEAT